MVSAVCMFYFSVFDKHHRIQLVLNEQMKHHISVASSPLFPSFFSNIGKAEILCGQVQQHGHRDGSLKDAKFDQPFGIECETSNDDNVPPTLWVCNQL
jgi:hypothetical protein